MAFICENSDSGFYCMHGRKTFTTTQEHLSHRLEVQIAGTTYRRSRRHRGAKLSIHVCRPMQQQRSEWNVVNSTSAVRCVRPGFYSPPLAETPVTVSPIFVGVGLTWSSSYRRVRPVPREIISRSKRDQCNIPPRKWMIRWFRPPSNPE